MSVTTVASRTGGGIDLASESIASFGTKDHDLLDGLGDDDHTIYALLAGRPAGQELLLGEDTPVRANISDTDEGGLIVTDKRVTVVAGGTGQTNYLTMHTGGIQARHWSTFRAAILAFVTGAGGGTDPLSPSYAANFSAGFTGAFTLQAKGNSAVGALHLTRTSPVEDFLFTTDGDINMISANPITFFTTNVDRMQITAAGLVRIGSDTFTPSAKLHVRAEAADGDAFWVEKVVTGVGTPRVEWEFGGNPATWTMKYRDTSFETLFRLGGLMGTGIADSGVFGGPANNRAIRYTKTNGQGSGNTNIEMVLQPLGSGGAPDDAALYVCDMFGTGRGDKIFFGAAGDQRVIIGSTGVNDIIFYKSTTSEMARFLSSPGAFLINATTQIASELLRVNGAVAIDGDFNHDGTNFGALGQTPRTQFAKINDPAGGATVDAEARTAINAIIDALEGFGFSAAV